MVVVQDVGLELPLELPLQLLIVDFDGSFCDDSDLKLRLLGGLVRHAVMLNVEFPGSSNALPLLKPAAAEHIDPLALPPLLPKVLRETCTETILILGDLQNIEPALPPIIIEDVLMK